MNPLGTIFISFRTLNQARKSPVPRGFRGKQGFQTLTALNNSGHAGFIPFFMSWDLCQFLEEKSEKSNVCAALVQSLPGVPVIALIWIIVKIKSPNIYKFHKRKGDAPHSYNNISDTEIKF